MQVVPVTVGTASRAWDEQHNDVTAAAEQVGGASTSGFTDGVSGAASRFVTTWQRHTSTLADQAESQADGLRTSIADFLETDQAAGFEAIALLAYLEEAR